MNQINKMCLCCSEDNLSYASVQLRDSYNLNNS